MNWSRGKNRLIILFFSINLLLGWANYRKDTSAYVLKETQVDAIKTVLAQSNIYVDAQIPKRYKPLKNITVSPFQINSAVRDDFVKRLLQTLEGVTVSIEAPKAPDEKPRRVYRQDDQVVIFEGENILYRNEGNIGAAKMQSSPFNIQEAEKIAEQWLRQMGYSAKKMHMQIIEESDSCHVIYYDKYNGIPIFDSYVKMEIASSGIQEVEIHKVEIGESIGERQEIYSVDQVFFSLIKQIAVEKPTHIKNIMIGYALENPKGTHLIAEKALPFYQVILEDGRMYYINAYNSEIREEPQL